MIEPRIRLTASPFALTYPDAIGVTDGDVRPLLAILSGEDSMTGGQRWMDEALCAEVDPEIFFLDKGGSPARAKRICAGCPVREPCLEYALENGERFGVWGGTTEVERRRLRKQAAA